MGAREQLGQWRWPRRAWPAGNCDAPATPTHLLDDLGQYPEFRATETTLRWIMPHMIEETARHAGHMDAIRELLDGQNGYY